MVVPNPNLHRVPHGGTLDQRDLGSRYQTHLQKADRDRTVTLQGRDPPALAVGKLGQGSGAILKSHFKMAPSTPHFGRQSEPEADLRRTHLSVKRPLGPARPSVKVGPLRPRLPIDEVLGPLIDHLEAPGANAVLVAPPGAGKTTCVPPALLERLARGQIIVAQPRRLAARMAASTVARWRRQDLGREVGYAVRFEARSGADTRLLFVTEGVLLRRLRDDPQLTGVSAILFDEIHERHLAGDLALALARRNQRELRPDLRLLAMSATLDPGPLADFLEAPTFESRGRAHRVEVEYLVARDRPLEAQVLRALQTRVEAAPTVDVDGLGHILVFLPGASEIRRCASKLAGYCDHHGLVLRPLHASLPPDEQDLAVAPSERPKVILSTNVAETSLTIDQVAQNSTIMH